MENPTNPARFCVNCANSFQVLEHGEWYCRLVKMPVNPVTGKQYNAFCSMERADQSRCGKDGVHFVPNMKTMREDQLRALGVAPTLYRVENLSEDQFKHLLADAMQKAAVEDIKT